MAFAPDRATLYAALRTPPFPVTAFAVDPVSGKLDGARHRAAARADGLYRGRRPAAHVAGRVLQGRPRLGERDRVGRRAGAADASAGDAAQGALHHPRPPRRRGLRHDRRRQRDPGVSPGRRDRQARARRSRIASCCRPGSGPRHLALHPRLAVLYCVNETAGTLAAFAIDDGGRAARIAVRDADAAGLHRQRPRRRPARHRRRPLCLCERARDQHDRAPSASIPSAAGSRASP